MNSESPLLELRNVSRRTGEGDILLESISWAINAGESWALIGPSGSGKTLLLRTIAQLDPFEGMILWKGNSVDPTELPAYRSQVTYLAQQPTLLSGTVENNLVAPFQWTVHENQTAPLSQYSDWLTRFGRSPDFLKADGADLSGGERQIVALLRALSLEPTILLLDEATSALDAHTKLQFESLVSDWIDREPQTRSVVWVTHDETQSQRVADHALRLEQGRISKEDA